MRKKRKAPYTEETTRSTRELARRAVPVNSAVLNRYKPKTTYPHCKIVEVATRYILGGTLKQIAAETGVKQATAYTWSHREWWEPLLDEIRSEKEREIEGAYRKILESGTRAIQDRLEHGDVVVRAVRGENGEELQQVRVPMRGRDASVVTGIAFDKLRLLNNQPTAITEKRSLEDLAEQFRQISREQSIEGKARVVRSGAD